MHAQKEDNGVAEDVSLEMLRKYVCYAKMKIRPTLSEEAQHML